MPHGNNASALGGIQVQYLHVCSKSGICLSNVLIGMTSLTASEILKVCIEKTAVASISNWKLY